jgi:tRNA/rRNA methyltransferase
MAPTGPLSRIRVVLVEPSHPGNIGAAARALRTMGLGRLFLVRPRVFPHRDAVALASNALDVLDAARVCATLDQALEGTVLSVALSARGRDLSHPVQDARAAAGEVVRVAAQGEAALVFGSETAGLSNEDVLRCSRLATVPSDPECSSLNLAQAVQVLAYEVRMAAVRWSPSKERAPDYASHEEVESFYAHFEASIVGSGFLDPKAPRRLMERMRRLFGRARLEREEVNILRGMLTSWDEGPHTGPRAPKRDPGKNS